MKNQSRREFLKFGSISLLGAAALGTLSFKSAPAMAAGKLPLVSESDAQAKSFGYYADASKVDKKKWTKKAGPDGDRQKCSNCILFNGGKVTADAEGPCPLFPGKGVAAKGWCNSWQNNPAAK